MDESSILEAMEQVQDEISQLDESIQEYQDSDEENVIESSVSGRVKKINVSAGSDLSDIMVSDGALMVLSLDGKMAVFLSGVSGVSAGDSVTVTLSSGTQVTGTVDSASGEDCVVTLTGAYDPRTTGNHRDFRYRFRSECFRKCKCFRGNNPADSGRKCQ
mgnify:CR=1 FL=1